MLKSILLLLIFAVPIAAQNLVAQKIRLQNGESFDLNLPDGYEIIPAAENLKRARFFAKAPDGRIFVTDLYNLTDNRRGIVYVLDEWNPETGKFGKVAPFLTDLRNPNSAQFYTDAGGQHWFYLAETDRLTRRKYVENSTEGAKEFETVATFPDYGLDYKYGGWHLTRTMAFSPNGKIYVSVGSSCNACDEKEEIRAAILEMNPDGGEQRVYAKGLRNAVDIKWIGKFLFATNQGSDHLGARRPDETFYAVRDGADYGWASCYSANGKIFFDRTAPSNLKKPTARLKNCAGVPAPYAHFPARSSALGFEYFDEADADARLRNSFLVALHGSTDKTIGSGYKLVTFKKGEKPRDFITGFLQDRRVVGRPCGIFKIGADAFFFTDDASGVVYLVRKKGARPEIAASRTETARQFSENSSTSAPENPANGGNYCFGWAVLLCAAFARSIF